MGILVKYRVKYYINTLNEKLFINVVTIIINNIILYYLFEVIDQMVNVDF